MKRRSSKSPSRADIAREARVSLATASLALNNHPRVTPRTKLRVVEAAARLGYVPNQAARRLIRSRFAPANDPFDQVGFLFMDPMRHELDGVYLSMLRGAERELSRLGAAMVFSRVQDDGDRAKVARLVRAGWVDAWLVIGDVDDATLDLVQADHRPCVVLGGHRCKRPVHGVDVDFLATGRVAVQHLAGLGHRRIGYLGGSMRHAYQHEMLRGFQEAVKQLGLDDDASLIQTVSSRDREPQMERLNQLMALRPLPTAIFGAEVNYGFTIIELLRQREVQVPGEISVMGCEIDGRPRTQPGFARIETPFLEVGRAGASMLRETAMRPDGRPRQARVSPAVVEGWSCGQHKPRETFGDESDSKSVSAESSRKENAS